MPLPTHAALQEENDRLRQENDELNKKLDAILDLPQMKARTRRLKRKTKPHRRKDKVPRKSGLTTAVAHYRSGSGLSSASDPLERHFSPQELAARWILDESTVRRMFQDEPGVLKIGKRGRRDGKRDYVTLRIPESIARRKHREQSHA